MTEDDIVLEGWADDANFRVKIPDIIGGIDRSRLPMISFADDQGPDNLVRRDSYVWSAGQKWPKALNWRAPKINRSRVLLLSAADEVRNALNYQSQVTGEWVSAGFVEGGTVHR